MKFDKYYTPPGRYCYFRSFLRNTYWEENPVKAVIATSLYIEAVPGLFSHGLSMYLACWMLEVG